MNLRTLFLCAIFIAISFEVEAKRKPNILIILADDVGTGDIPAYWNSSNVEMPNIDRLASKGITFKDAHSSSACAPSRYMLLSGNYAHRGVSPRGLYRFEASGNQFLNGQKSIAEVLRDEAGYATAMFGKWHLGAGVPRDAGAKRNLTHHLTGSGVNWTRRLIQGPQDIGFDSSVITTGGIQSSPYSFFRNGYLSTNISDVKYWEDGEYKMQHGTSKILYSGEGSPDWDSSAYNMIVVNETIQFIDDHLEQENDDPFFAYVALGAVHSPHSPPDFYLDGSRVANTTETRHLDMLKELDMIVGSLVSAVESRNLTEETIIIFTSDNGGLPASNRITTHKASGKLRGFKGSIYEGGHRVPLIMQYQSKHGFPGGQERNHLVGLNDIYATICDLIGIEVPYFSAQDSISFADYTFHEKNTDGLRQEFAHWNYKPFGMRGNLHTQAIRFGDMKLVHYFNTSFFELYNLKSDPSETNNLIGEDEHDYAALVQEMYNQLKAVGPCPNDVNTFQLLTNNSDTKQMDCTWFEADRERCGQYIEGRLFCPSICAGIQSRKICSVETIPPALPIGLGPESESGPSSSPSALMHNCEDSPSYMKQKRPGKRTSFMKCSTLLNMKPRSCEKPRFASHCPASCNQCDKFKCKNSKMQFRVSGENLRCRDIKMPQCLGSALVRATCRKKCGVCDN